MISSKILSRFASVKEYDLICIGAYATKVGTLINKNVHHNLMKKLLIQNQQQVLESQLYNISKDPFIKINRKWQNHGTQLIDHLGVKSIIPKENKIITADGLQYRYKYLIYSASQEQWKDKNCNSNLSEALETPASFIYSDYHPDNVFKLYKRNNGEVFFVIPKEKHFGCQNYFMLHLMSTITAKKPEIGYKITVLNQGDKMVPYSDTIEQIIQNQLRAGGIEVINNSKIDQINYKERYLQMSQKKLSFNSLFHYLPFKVPKLLEQSSINPLNVDQKLLHNQEYPNIYIMGNLFPTAYSFYSMNFMSHVISNNVANRFLKIGRMAQYGGQSAFGFWNSKNSLRYLTLNYQGAAKYNNIGNNSAVGRILAWDKNHFGQKQIDLYLNKNSFGIPFYFKSPQLQEKLISDVI